MPCVGSIQSTEHDSAKTERIQVYAYKAQKSLDLNPMLLDCITWPELKAFGIPIISAACDTKKLC